MGRPRAGHGWTGFFRKGRFIALMTNDKGEWITTGSARGWPRCTRCRRPYEHDPFDSKMCTTCYFYKSGLPIKDFWRLHDEGHPLAPYNIGKMMMARMVWDRNPLEDPKINWRRYLKSQTH